MADIDEDVSDVEQEVYPDDTEKDESDKEDQYKSKTITNKKFTGNIDSEDDDDDDELLLEDDSDTDESTEEKNPLTYIETTGEMDDVIQLSPINSDVESDDEDFLKKFDPDNRTNYINKYHPECFIKNSIEVESLTKIVRDENNTIIDSNHKTNPFLTKYERTKILGQRTKQLNLGTKPLIPVPDNIIDNYLIAQLELKEKVIPVIIRRPLPGGKSEYWKLKDLEII